MSKITHVVGFSGGIDSQACALWVRRKFPNDPIVLLNANAGGNEHTITTQFIEQYSQEVFPVVRVDSLMKDMLGRCKYHPIRQQLGEDAPLTFDTLALMKGIFPSRRKQFCTEHLKLIPSKRWCDENLTAKGIPYDRYNGIRCDESQQRRSTPESKWDDFFQCMVYSPIRCWSKLECFAVVQRAGEPINPLYSMGFKRVGCAPCVNSSKTDVRNWAARFPDVVDKVRRWEWKTNRTFFMPCVPGLEINWVDDVVAWSRTERGGRQGLLLLEEADAAAGVCDSHYGLCE